MKPGWRSASLSASRAECASPDKSPATKRTEGRLDPSMAENAGLLPEPICLPPEFSCCLVPAGPPEVPRVKHVEDGLAAHGVEQGAVGADQRQGVPAHAHVSAGDRDGASGLVATDGELQDGRGADAEIQHFAAGGEETGCDAGVDHGA